MLLTICSEGPPEKQAEQVLAIYPIVKGQKASQRNAIPPRGTSFSGPSANQAPEAKGSGDLIDFGGDDNAADLPAPMQPTSGQKEDPKVESSGEISGLLKQTGTPAPNGPLIDFHEDLQKNVPSIKRSDTEESNDDFVDAHE